LVFALAWLYLPFWLFALLALYCYFVPAFHAGRLFVLFFTLLVLCYAEPSTGPGAAAMAVIFGAIFYYLLLKKDLLLLDRATAHELLVIILSFFLFREFFMAFGQGPTVASLVWVFLTALLFALLLNNLITNLAVQQPGSASKGNQGTLFRRTAVLLSFILMTQCLFIALFLPLNFIYQSTIVFLIAVLLIELLPDHVAGTLSETKIQLAGSVVFGLLVLVLGIAKW
jgi:hypothetical protein